MTCGTCLASAIIPYPGSVKTMEITEGPVMMEIYYNSASVDANFDFYRAVLMEDGWKEPGVYRKIARQSYFATIMMEKDSYVCCIGFEQEERGFTYITVIIVNEGRRIKKE